LQLAASPTKGDTLFVNLDIFSVFMACSLMGAMLGLVLTGLSQRMRQVPGLSEWAITAWLWSAGLGLTAVQNSLTAQSPFRLVTYIGSALIVLGVSYFWNGMRHFRHVPPVSPLLLYIPAAIVLMFTFFFVTVEPSNRWRLLTSSSISAVLCGLAAYASLRRPTAPFSFGLTLAGVPLALMSLIFSARTVALLAQADIPNILVPTPLNIATACIGSATLISSLMGVVLCANAYLVELLAHQAQTDVLTGALGRRGFYERSPAWVAANRGKGVALVMDLDHFKPVNDTLGHEEGDEVLRALVKAALVRLPEHGMFARVGGDEFIALLPDEPTAAKFAGELRRDFARTIDSYLAVAALPFRPDISSGCALIQDTLDEALRNADIALYASKASREGGASSRIHSRVMV
jgi:diguanylate cyclase (GGDEF)-like protein